MHPDDANARVTGMVRWRRYSRSLGPRSFSTCICRTQARSWHFSRSSVEAPPPPSCGCHVISAPSLIAVGLWRQTKRSRTVQSVKRRILEMKHFFCLLGSVRLANFLYDCYSSASTYVGGRGDLPYVQGRAPLQMRSRQRVGILAPAQQLSGSIDGIRTPQRFTYCSSPLCVSTC